MSDLIDRQAAIDALGEEPLIWRNTLEEITARAQWRQDRNAILSVPSAQPVIRGVIDESGRIKFIEQSERNKGKWIVHPEVKNVYGGTYIECPQCGEKYVVQHMEDEKYCRNCGTKMEE